MSWKMVQACLRHPNSIVLYVVQSQDQAKNIVYPALQKIETTTGIQMRRKENPLEVIFPNGSKIKLVGAGTQREAEKLRGPNYPLVAIDEAQSFTRAALEYLVTDVAMPAMADYGDQAQMTLTGTPNAAKAGYFYDQWVKENGSNHHWTLFENIHMPDPVAFAAKMRRINGWTESSPTYLREYRGQWVRDESGLVYALNHHRNVFPGGFDRWKAQADDWAYTLGIDVGARSCTCFVVVAHSLELGQAWVVETQKYGGRKFGRNAVANNVTTSRMAAIIEKLRKQYDLYKVVLDTQGQGAAYQKDLMELYGVHVEAAKKNEKAAHIESMNSDLQAGVLKVCRQGNEDLIEEMEVLSWDPDKRDKGVLEEDTKSSDNHACDAALYAWRGGAHHALDWELEPKHLDFREQAEADKQAYFDSLQEDEDDFYWFEEPDASSRGQSTVDVVDLYYREY